MLYLTNLIPKIICQVHIKLIVIKVEQLIYWFFFLPMLYYFATRETSMHRLNSMLIFYKIQSSHNAAVTAKRSSGISRRKWFFYYSILSLDGNFKTRIYQHIHIWTWISGRSFTPLHNKRESDKVMHNGNQSRTSICNRAIHNTISCTI